MLTSVQVSSAAEIFVPALREVTIQRLH